MKAAQASEADEVASALRDAIRDERRRYLAQLNGLRLAALTLFTVLFAWLSYGVHETEWSVYLRPNLWYLAVSLGLWLAPRWVRGEWTLLALPLLDCPMLFWTQWTAAVASTDPLPTASFTAALFTLLILLSSFSMEYRVVVTTATVAMVLQFVLGSLVGASLGSRLSAVLVLALATSACSYASGRIRHLVKVFSIEQLRRARMGRYFSPAVALLVGELTSGASAAGSLEVSVLFSDIRDFTALSESLSCEAVVDLLNDYYECMVDIIFDYGGTLDKYIGDGIMAYFGAPMAQADHAARAVRCAMEMQTELVAFNQRQAAAGRPVVKIGVGIHTGTVILGEMGSSRRREYTAIGDTVNLASRIEGLTKQHGVGILVSEETRRQASELIQFESVAPVAVKGKSQPVETFVPTSAVQHPLQTVGWKL